MRVVEDAIGHFEGVNQDQFSGRSPVFNRIVDLMRRGFHDDEEYVFLVYPTDVSVMALQCDLNPKASWQPALVAGLEACVDNGAIDQ